MWTRPGDIPKKFALTPEELDHVETCDSDEEQRRFLEQIVIDKDLPVAMRTIQVRNIEYKQNNKRISPFTRICWARAIIDKPDIERQSI